MDMTRSVLTVSTETCSSCKLLNILLWFWLNDILVSTTTQRDGCYKKLNISLTKVHFVVLHYTLKS